MVVFGKYGDSVAVEEDLAAVVTELAYSKQVVLECGRDLAAADGEVGKVEVGGGKRRCGCGRRRRLHGMWERAG